MRLKVCFTYDFISTSPQRGLVTQSPKLEIFKNIVSQLNFDVDLNLQEFSQPKLYELAQFEIQNNIYNEIKLNNLNSKALEYLHSLIKEYNFLIGYELSRNTKEILEFLNIQYIDVWLSPVRFHKDIMFDFYSNNPQTMKVLNTSEYGEKKLLKRAQKIKEFSSNFFNKLIIENNSCLIIGQMLQDKSVLFNNRYLTLVDYQSELKKLSKQYAKLYLLKHPHMKEDDFDTIKNQLSNIKNLEVLSGINTYHLLSMKEIKCVAGISSSVLTEAKYFKKKVVYFYEPVIGLEYKRIYNKYYDLNFWKQILQIKSKKKFIFFADDNYFRLKYNLVYSYDIFLPTSHTKKLKLKEKYNSVVNFYNFLSKIDLNKKYILYGFGSLGKLLFPHLKNNILAIVDKVLCKELDTYQGIPIISIADVTNYENVEIIISPFLYTDSIILELEKYTNSILIIKI